MIIRDLPIAIASVLNGDAYHSALPGCRALVQGMTAQDVTGKVKTTAQLAKAALDTIGIHCLVSLPDIAPIDNVFAGADIAVVYVENPELNQGPRGTGKSAFELASKAWPILAGHFFAPWSPLIFDGMLEGDCEDEGLVAWGVKFRCQTLIDTVVELLADEDGALLVTENGEPLLNSPTDP